MALVGLGAVPALVFESANPDIRVVQNHVPAAQTLPLMRGSTK